jgi:hypothetical protein
LGFFDIFVTYASWFFENFQIQRTGVVAWEDWQRTVKGRFFDLIVIFVSFLFVNACNGDTLFGDISFHKTEQDCIV